MAVKTKLTLKNLRLLDFGKIETAFDEHLKRCVRDCLDRPGDDKPRQVTLRFAMTPVTDKTHGDCEEVHVDCEIFDAVPKHRTKIYTMRPHNDGSLDFNPDVADDPDQETLYNSTEESEDGHE